jgi:mRNA-degrading endonuclease RelE of RelBE toxin-antitoxin system
LEWRFRTKRGLGIMARRMKKRDKKWMWVTKPGDRIFVSRTAVLPSKQLSKREFRALEEIVNIYGKMLGDVLPHASRNIMGNYYRLKNGRYREPRNIYQISRPTMFTECVRMLLKEYPL